MSFKPGFSPEHCPILPGMGVLQVEGRDAAAFLQAQSMNDVAALAEGRWQWNGLLTPKGRVVFLFMLARIAGERFLLVAPDASAGELKAWLQRFVFRSKVQLRDDLGWQAAAAEIAAEAGSQVLDGTDGAFGLDLSGEGGPRLLWLLPAGHPAAAPEQPALAARWRQADLAHGLPRLAASQREAWTPQMLSLDRLQAFSLKKGCYPGQEIVARTHYLGQAKRGLQRLGADGPLEEGSAVTGPDGSELGRLACVAGHEALAVLPAALPAGTELSAGRPLRPMPLLGGLAR